MIMDNFGSVVEKIKEMTRIQTERELAEIVQNYDFIVGSKEAKYALIKALPKDANVVYSPFIEDPNLVYAVKKYDILDIFKREKEGN